MKRTFLILPIVALALGLASAQTPIGGIDSGSKARILAEVGNVTNYIKGSSFTKDGAISLLNDLASFVQTIPVTGSNRVLTSKDFTYAGSIRFPEGPQLSGAYGALGGIRTRPDGKKSMFVSSPGGNWVYEVSVPPPSLDPAQPSRCVILREYKADEFYHGTKPTVGWWAQGFTWDQATSTLLVTFGDFYAVAGTNNPVMCLVKILPDGTTQAWGPWRTSANSQLTRGYQVKVPQWFSDAYCPGMSIASGAGLESGTINGSFGCNLNAFTPPTSATPTTAVVPAQTLVGYEAAQDRRQRREPDYKMAGNIQYPPSGNVGYWPPLPDRQRSAVWIDTPTANGVVFFGKRATGWIWYGEALYTLPDGTVISDHFDHTQGKGYRSEYMESRWWFYDPLQFVPVVQGIAPSWSLVEKEHVNPAIFSPNLMTAGRDANGALWDPATSTAYIFHADTERLNYSSLGVIDCYLVNAK